MKKFPIFFLTFFYSAGIEPDTDEDKDKKDETVLAEKEESKSIVQSMIDVCPPFKKFLDTLPESKNSEDTSNNPVTKNGNDLSKFNAKKTPTFCVTKEDFIHYAESFVQEKLAKKDIEHNYDVNKLNNRVQDKNKIISNKDEIIYGLKGDNSEQKIKFHNLEQEKQWITRSALRDIVLFFVGGCLVYKLFLKDLFFPPKQEELYFNFVEAVAARNRGEYYVPPKPESKMTPEEKKARDLKLAKEKAEMEERKKREEIEKAQEKARDDRLARWDKLSDEAEELDLQKFERLHQERKEREIAEKKAREEAEKKEKERQEKEKREQEEEEKRKRAEEKRIEDAIARSIKEDEEKRKRWFSGILG